MKKVPLVSVIMPVYNSEKYLSEVIESILKQTFRNFEFLIFDDGSTDGSRAIIELNAKQDTRIIPYYSDVNRGYVVHLNRGIELSKGEFIARMDSDDISMPNRFQKQLDFLLAYVDIELVGSSTIIINENGKEVGVDHKFTESRNLYWECFFKAPFTHPSVMIKKKILNSVGKYNESKIPSEDYDLWTRIVRVGKTANLKEPLLFYRTHAKSISKLKNEDQIKQSLESQELLWKKTIKQNIPFEVLTFFRFYHTGFQLNPKFSIPAFQYLIQLYKYFELNKELSKEIKKDVFEKLFYLAAITRGSRKKDFLKLFLFLFKTFPRRTVFFLLDLKITLSVNKKRLQ